MPVAIDDARLLKKTVTLGVHFTPSVDAQADRDALEAFAQQVRVSDHRLFNRYGFGKTAPNGLPTTLLFERDILLRGVGQAHNTPLVVFPNFLEMALLYRLPEAPHVEIDGQERPRDEEFDALARAVMRVFWERVNVDVNRIGKVYEYVWGPFDESTVQWIAEHFLRVPAGFEMTNGTALLVTAVEGHNVSFSVSTGQTPLGSVIIAKVDVNNVDNTQRLEIRNLDSILAFATRFNSERFRGLMGG